MTGDRTTLTAAVVGTGFIGVVHVDALRRLGVEVAGVVGSTRERAEAKRVAPAYESYEALLADERVDVVHITTPNHLHYPQVKQALEAGKHVVCEKPLALTAEQSAELLELAERSGLVHCTNFNIRFYPMVQEARARAAELLTVVGLGGRRGHRPSELSGGQMQRVAVARALVARPAVLLADEPTGNLDSTTGQEILDLLKDLQRQFGQTIVMVTHDPRAAGLADRVVHLRDGSIETITEGDGDA